MFSFDSVVAAAADDDDARRLTNVGSGRARKLGGGGGARSSPACVAFFAARLRRSAIGDTDLGTGNLRTMRRRDRTGRPPDRVGWNDDSSSLNGAYSPRLTGRARNAPPRPA